MRRRSGRGKGMRREAKIDANQRALLQGLPKIDELLLILEKRGLAAAFPREAVRDACRTIVARLREEILSVQGGSADLRLPSPEAAAGEAAAALETLRRPHLRRVVNATGVVLHTNLGRAPLCPAALARMVEVGRGYANLEFDLAKGERGLRYDHVRDLLVSLTGAEDALVVNNNAAAVLLVLNTLADGKEVIVSRGELVEIGGEFRVPDVMARSGAGLREVGTTNRTRLGDYARALGPETAALLKVHTSNFRIVGFTEEASLAELARLGRERGIPVVYDLGSGCLVDLERHGLEKEPTVRESLASGADVVTFSGDKLLGGPQTGIILGRADILDKVKRNPLNRALRIDKLTLAALEATLAAYLASGEPARDLPVLRALTETEGEVRRRAKRLLASLRRSAPAGYTFALRRGTSMAGGGSLPGREIPTILVAVRSALQSAGQLEGRLRRLDPPIIARVAGEEVLLDARTIADEELPLVRRAFLALGGP